ncbi:hypothetical protein O7A70_29735 [Mesorhizobium sp. Cs1299R1N1]
MSSLLGASLRLCPARIFMGELRSEQAFDFLNAINPGIDEDYSRQRPARGVRSISTLVSQQRRAHGSLGYHRLPQVDHSDRLSSSRKVTSTAAA